ncbi:MAG: putative toxin-antitoxin system toxin component, PIN family [Cyclobacteriaceae bacterium]
MELPNVEKIEIYFKWNLIKDMDDNKFIDCAVAAGANYLVTQDKDFNILEKTEFPKIKSISMAGFKRKLL